VLGKQRRWLGIAAAGAVFGGLTLTAAAPATAAGEDCGRSCGQSDGGGSYSASAQQISITGGTRSGDTGGGTVVVVKSEPVYNPCRWEQGPTAEELLGRSEDPFLNGIIRREGVEPDWPPDLQANQGQAGHYYYGVCTSGGWPGETLDQFFAFTHDFFDRNPSYVWVPAGSPPPGPPPLPPSVLMEYARNAVQVPQPQVNRNPGGNAVVNLPTWFWLNRATFDEISVTASTGPNWATVTVSPQTMTVAAPDAQQQGSCASGGAAYDTSRSPSAQSTDCALQFHRSSARLGGAHPVTVSTGWSASWTGSDGSGGTLEGTTQSTTVQVPVSEIQTVVTR
jgi:hypothetical protein